eukprot:SAG22_NODE_16194_length_331_cov_0.646552_1_plen_32_part_01
MGQFTHELGDQLGDNVVEFLPAADSREQSGET